MFKKLLFIASIGLLSIAATAQNNCVNGRYMDPIFPEVLVTAGVPFGMAPTTFDTLGIPGADTVTTYPLFMDVYQPLQDLGSKPRPTIIFAFGGAFVYGARVSPDIVKLCNMYAQLGYVTVSIDYRLSDELLVNPSPENATKAVLKGVHDMKSAIRYLRRQAAELGNVFAIDTNQIYVGGVSAGAFCAIHCAYLDEEAEIPEILKSTAAKYGGIEGISGNPGYSSRVSGVINLCGAIGDTAWIAPGNVPIVSMHGTADETVPYDHDTIRILGINYPVHGSASIHRHITSLNEQNPDQQIQQAFYTWEGAGHVPFVTDSAYFDTTFRFTRDFMYTQVCSNSTGLQELSQQAGPVKVFPNPTKDVVKIVAMDPNYEITLVDAQGKKLLVTRSQGIEVDIDMSNYPTGIYLANLVGNKIRQTVRIIKD